jgi:hypothetical protein
LGAFLLGLSLLVRLARLRNRRSIGRDQLADCLARALRRGQADLDTERTQTLARLQQRERAVQSKLDRAYDDYQEGRIQEAFWTRKSAEWEAELTTVKAELARLSSAPPAYATGERILELAKSAHFLYLKQDPTEQRRLLETLLSNCTFDRGSLCRTYTKPFDVLAAAINSTVVAGENPTVGSTVWLPAESVAPGR